MNAPPISVLRSELHREAIEGFRITLSEDTFFQSSSWIAPELLKFVERLRPWGRYQTIDVMEICIEAQQADPPAPGLTQRTVGGLSGGVTSTKKPEAATWVLGHHSKSSPVYTCS